VMEISEQLHVGDGDGEYCPTAAEAVAVIERCGVAVVPTRRVARETLRRLGLGEAWISFAIEYAGDRLMVRL
jgi:hypothetical protein